MREIKFRAWDTVEKEMIPWEDVLGNLWLYVSGNYTDKYPLMQYTGLKDKNGKEIYEGDILESTSKELLGVVTFADGKFGWNIRYKKPELNQRQDYFGRSFANQEDASKLKIIGNIQENPELLEVKDVG